MSAQGNLVCKGRFDVRQGLGANNLEFNAPKGRLKEIRVQMFRGGANSRLFYLRCEKLSIKPLTYVGAVVGGFDDWYAFWNTGNPDQVFTISCDVTDPGPIMYRGPANADGHGWQISLYYDPDCEEPFRTNPEKPQAVNRG